MGTTIQVALLFLLTFGPLVFVHLLCLLREGAPHMNMGPSLCRYINRAIWASNTWAAMESSTIVYTHHTDINLHSIGRLNLADLPKTSKPPNLIPCQFYLVYRMYSHKTEQIDDIAYEVMFACYFLVMLVSLEF